MFFVQLKFKNKKNKKKLDFFIYLWYNNKGYGKRPQNTHTDRERHLVHECGAVLGEVGGGQKQNIKNGGI